MNLNDLREAYLEYISGGFTKRDFAEYKEMFLHICQSYGWDSLNPMQRAYFEVIYVMDDSIPYDDNMEYISPLTGLHYKEGTAVYPDVHRYGDFVLIGDDWRIL